MDIDINMADNSIIKELFGNRITYASREENGELKQHNVGAYFQKIPIDKETGLAAIPYKRSEEFGYYKIDFLRVKFLEGFKSKLEIRELLKIDPDWSMLEDVYYFDNKNTKFQLFQIGNHFDLIFQIRPTSIDDLADALAFILPGKIKLLDKYLKNKDLVRDELHTKRLATDFRKSHSYAYAMMVVLHMHLLKHERNKL